MVVHASNFANELQATHPSRKALEGTRHPAALRIPRPKRPQSFEKRETLRYRSPQKTCSLICRNFFGFCRKSPMSRRMSPVRPVMLS
jgi:hypothetical protein